MLTHNTGLLWSSAQEAKSRAGQSLPGLSCLCWPTAWMPSKEAGDSRVPALDKGAGTAGRGQGFWAVEGPEDPATAEAVTGRDGPCAIRPLHPPAGLKDAQGAVGTEAGHVGWGRPGVGVEQGLSESEVTDRGYGG